MTTTAHVWKYKPGDLVTPIVQEDHGHRTKMIVTARMTEERIDVTEHSYIVSHYKLGDYVRQRLFESELAPYEKEAK